MALSLRRAQLTLGQGPFGNSRRSRCVAAAMFASVALGASLASAALPADDADDRVALNLEQVLGGAANAVALTDPTHT
jgi:hypothetical protein